MDLIGSAFAAFAWTAPWRGARRRMIKLSRRVPASVLRPAERYPSRPVESDTPRQRFVRFIGDAERSIIEEWHAAEALAVRSDIAAGTYRPGMNEAFQSLRELASARHQCSDLALIDDDAPSAVLRFSRSADAVVRFVFRPRTGPARAGTTLAASIVDRLVADGAPMVHATHDETLCGKRLLVGLRFLAGSPLAHKGWRLPAERWRAHRAHLAAQIVHVESF